MHFWTIVLKTILCNSLFKCTFEVWCDEIDSNTHCGSIYIICMLIINVAYKNYPFSSLTLDNCYVKFQTTKDKNDIMFHIPRETKKHYAYRSYINPPSSFKG